MTSTCIANKSENSQKKNEPEQDDVVLKATDILTHMPEGIIQHRHPQMNEVGAQSSHSIMGSGGQSEMRQTGSRRFPRTLQPGELFQKIHSTAFFVLAGTVGALDMATQWIKTKANDVANFVWGTPTQVAYPSLARTSSGQDRHGLPTRHDSDVNEPAGPMSHRSACSDLIPAVYGPGGKSKTE